jgi:hypothetical protein
MIAGPETLSEIMRQGRPRQQARAGVRDLNDLHYQAATTGTYVFVEDRVTPHSMSSQLLQSYAESVTTIAAIASITLSAQLRNKIYQLAVLPENWDGEGAKQIKSFLLANVVGTLIRLSQVSHNFQEPFVAPTFDGLVLLDWHANGRSLEIQSTETGWEAVGTQLGVKNTRQYHTAEFGLNDFAKIRSAYQWFVGDEWIWPFP